MHGSESEIMARIDACRRTIIAVERDLAKATRDRSDLAEFAQRYGQRASSMQADVVARERFLAAHTDDSGRVRSQGGVRAAVERGLVDSRRYVGRFEGYQAGLRRGLQRLDDEIAQQGHVIRREREELAQLTQELALVRVAAGA